MRCCNAFLFCLWYHFVFTAFFCNKLSSFFKSRRFSLTDVSRSLISSHWRKSHTVSAWDHRFSLKEISSSMSRMLSSISVILAYLAALSTFTCLGLLLLSVLSPITIFKRDYPFLNWYLPLACSAFLAFCNSSPQFISKMRSFSANLATSSFKEGW